MLFYIAFRSAAYFRLSIAKVYNDAAQGKEGRGKIIGLEGDIRSKVGYVYKPWSEYNS